MNDYIRMEHITKRFPGVTANEDVTIGFRKGEIHALLGENGAGKSTLMNMLYGLLKPDEGQITVDGKPVRIAQPQDAIALGIGMVHQHFMLIPKFTVLENIILGAKLEHEPLLNTAQARQKIQDLAQRTGLKVDPDARIHDLSVGDQQRVEIIKVLYKGVNVLIMDEPTAVLTPQETDELFLVLRNWIKEGNTVIFITHKMREVLEFCDRVSVMYAGHIMEQGNVNDIFYSPAHPYTKGLLRSMPNLGDEERTRLIPIEGTPVDLLDPPKGCSFGPRCEHCMKVCLTKKPPLMEVGEGHISACWLHVKEMQEQQKAAKEEKA